MMNRNIFCITYSTPRPRVVILYWFSIYSAICRPLRPHCGPRFEPGKSYRNLFFSVRNSPSPPPLECHDQRPLFLRLRHRGHKEPLPLRGEEAEPQARAPPLPHPPAAPANTAARATWSAPGATHTPSPGSGGPAHPTTVGRHNRLELKQWNRCHV